MERLLEDVSFHAARRTGETIAIDAAYVDARLAGIAGDDNLVAVHPLTSFRSDSRWHCGTEPAMNQRFESALKEPGVHQVQPRGSR